MNPAILDNTNSVVEPKFSTSSELILGGTENSVNSELCSELIPLFETGTLVGSCLRTTREEFMIYYFKSRRALHGKCLTIHKLQTPIDISYPDTRSELFDLMEEIPLDSNKIHLSLLRARRQRSFYRKGIYSTPDTHTSLLCFPDGGWMLVEDQIQSLDF